MKKKIEKLMAPGGLEDEPEFAEFIEEYNSFPELGAVENCGKECISEMVKAFFEEYMAAHKEHVEDVWTSDKIAPYVLACSNPEVTHLYAKYIDYHANNEGNIEDDAGNIAPYPWPSGEFKLAGHNITGATTTVNIEELMRHLTKADVTKVLDDPIIKACIDDIHKLALETAPVNIRDKSSWGDGKDFNKLYMVVTEMILIHPVHNQGIESMVLACAKVRKTGVEETRASARINMESYLVRRYNNESVAAKKAMLKAKQEKEGVVDEKKISNVTRTKDKERNMGIGDKVDEFCATIERLEKEDDYKERYDAVLLDITSKESKYSKELREKKTQQFANAVKAKRKVVAAETKKEGVLLTCAVGGKIKTSYLRAGVRGHDDVLRAELKARGEVYSNDVWKSMQWRPKIAKLKEQELKVLAIKEGGSTTSAGKAMTVAQVTEVVPVSGELKAHMNAFKEWHSAKRG
jgi:hypothetical protein